MAEDDTTRVTRLLNEVAQGKPGGADELLAVVYDHLRRIAQVQMQGERAGHTLQATALVNEAYLRLMGREEPVWRDRSHFFFAAAEAMRRILIEHARSKGRQKRGGGRQRMPLDVLDLAAADDSDQIVSVDDAIRRLQEHDHDLGQIVRLRFFAGLSEREIGEALGISERTVRREWTFAKAWLHRELGSADDGGGP